MRILIFTNGSLNNDPALLLGCRVLRRIDEPPTLLTVVDPTLDRHPPMTEAALAEACKVLGTLRARTRVRIGYFPDELLAEIKEGNYDLVILPEIKKSWILKRTKMDKIVEQVSCPILVAKGKTGKPIRRILLCDSGASQESVLGRFTAKLATLLDGEEEITILHVMSQISAGPGVRGAQLRAEAESLIQEHTPEGDLLERDLQALQGFGLRTVPKVRHGLVIDEILAEAKSEDYDLVVIGAHRRQGWQGYLLDDLARKIMLQLDRPVLIVK
jgi:nucleotide-binding universal stress UspA family protein